MTMTIPTFNKDVYKEFHVHAAHPEVSESYGNFTNRHGKHSNIEGNETVCNVGLQYVMMDTLIADWDDGFFALPKYVASNAHKRIMSSMLGYEIDVTYLENLHDLGYLPIEIKSLPEGELVPYGVPCLTIRNTVEGFEWLPLMLETVISQELWPIQTSATTAVAYFKEAKRAMLETGMPLDLLPFMIHDFSSRGMFGKQAAAMSGFGHLAAGNCGTDTPPAVLFAEQYYQANVDKELVGASVNATEHSITCAWEAEGEEAYIRHLMTNVAPQGILAVVSDTWDFWNLVTNILPKLKDEIMTRDGKLVIRPDSGDPVKILTGYTENELTRFDGKVYKRLFGNPKVAETDFSKKAYDNETQLEEWEIKGLVECLWDIFGGTETEKGFKLLDEHIGAIYGDSITLKRQKEINARLAAKGFAPQVVLGVGSYSYQYVTRDTHGSAMKATNVVKAGVDTPIAKDPKTDSKKKSARGFLRVDRDENGKLYCTQNVTREEAEGGLLQTVFLDGVITRFTSLAEIRQRVAEQI